MKNREIRDLIVQRRLKHYEVAEALGVNECTFSKWLRKELPDSKKEHIISVIMEIE